jgi:hypothetical protein
MSNQPEDDFSVPYEKLPVTARPVTEPPITLGGAGGISATPGGGTRRLIATRADFHAASAEVTALASRELRIFDTDLSELGFEGAEMEARIGKLLHGSRTNRLLVAVREIDYITQSCPRLIRLLRQYGHAIFIHRINDAIRNLEDIMVIADDAHYLRRPNFAQPKGAVVLNDANETRGWLNRFEEIWEQSTPAVSATTLGL